PPQRCTTLCPYTTLFRSLTRGCSPIAVHSVHAYEVRPRKDHRGVDLISNALPVGQLWYHGPNAASNAIGYAQFILLAWFEIPCVDRKSTRLNSSHEWISY